MQPIVNRDIVVVGQQPWDVTIGSNCKNIALEFSKHNRVLYVNSPLDRITSIRDRNNPDTKKRLRVISKKENGLQELNKNMWTLYPDCIVESVNWIGIDSVFDFVNRRNGKAFARSIKQALSKLGFKDIILFNDNEIIKCFYLKEFLAPSLSIYYSRDYILATDYWRKRGERLEPRVIRQNDLCVANSTYLADYCRQYNPDSFYVGQGCELEIFQQTTIEVPVEFNDLKGPVIGYVGALLGMRLDLEILKYIASQRPGWNIMLVGPEDDLFRACELHNLPNVIFTGSRSVDLLPGYIKGFDVCINPQVLNQLTIGNYPRKIDEYLAMGKPVVATATKAMESFAGYVELATNREEYLSLIEHAMKNHSPKLAAKRKSFAAGHTWENSVKEIYQAVQRFNQDKTSPDFKMIHEPQRVL